MIKPENKRIFSIVVLCLALLQIIVIVTRYLQARSNLQNPLIPQSLVDHVAEFSGIMLSLYIIVALLNIFYLLRKKAFITIAVISSIILIGLALFGQYFHSAYFNVNQ